MGNRKNAPTRPRRPPTLHRRGTAMVEFTLVVPFLAVILGLTFFFGWALMHKHQVVVANRYAAWQRIETGSWPGSADLNELCFADKAVDISINGEGTSQQTGEDLVEEVGAISRDAEDLADELVLNRFPVGRRAHVAARFNRHQMLWTKFSSDIRGHHGREGITWRRDEVNCWGTLRDQYYLGFDEALKAIPPPADGMAGMIRGLYLTHW